MDKQSSLRGSRGRAHFEGLEARELFSATIDVTAPPVPPVSPPLAVSLTAGPTATPRTFTSVQVKGRYKGTATINNVGTYHLKVSVAGTQVTVSITELGLSKTTAISSAQFTSLRKGVFSASMKTDYGTLGMSGRGKGRQRRDASLRNDHRHRKPRRKPDRDRSW